MLKRSYTPECSIGFWTLQKRSKDGELSKSLYSADHALISDTHYWRKNGKTNAKQWIFQWILTGYHKAWMWGLCTAV